MKALVLCGGHGTRMAELTRHAPKPLLRLGPSETILDHILQRLTLANFDEVWINVHYHAEQIRAHLKRVHANSKLHIHVFEEPELRGTAGTAADVMRTNDLDELLVHYGDIVTDHDLAEFSAPKLPTGARLLLHSTKSSNSVVDVEEGRVVSFSERPSGSPSKAQWLAFSGISLVHKNCLHEIPASGVWDLPRDIFQHQASRGIFEARTLQGYRWAIDSPERLTAAREALYPTTPQAESYL